MFSKSDVIVLEKNVVERKEMSMLLPHELLHSTLMVNDVFFCSDNGVHLLTGQTCKLICKKLHGMGFADADGILLLSKRGGHSSFQQQQNNVFGDDHHGYHWSGQPLPASGMLPTNILQEADDL